MSVSKTPSTVTLFDLAEHDIHLREDDDGRCEVYVSAVHSSRREVILWQEGDGYLGERWPAIAEAVCWWLNLPEAERVEKRRKQIEISEQRGSEPTPTPIRRGRMLKTVSGSIGIGPVNGTWPEGSEVFVLGEAGDGMLVVQSRVGAPFDYVSTEVVEMEPS